MFAFLPARIPSIEKLHLEIACSAENRRARQQFQIVHEKPIHLSS